MSTLLGIPFASEGFRLAGVRQDGSDRLVLHYVATDGAGHVNVIVMPATSLERQVARLKHVSLYYEADLPIRNLEHRAKAAELMQFVGGSVDDWLEQADTARFPEGLAGSPGKERFEFHPREMRELLSGLATADLPLGSRICDVFPSRDGLTIEFGAEASRCRVLLGVTRGHAKRAMLRSARLSISMQTLGPKEDKARPELSALAQLCALALTLREGQLSFPLHAPPASSPWGTERKLQSVEDPDDAALTKEASLLQPTLAAASEYFGAQSFTEYFEAPRPALRILFAPVPPHLATGPTYFLAAPESFRQRRVFSDYLRTLGYFVEADGLVRTVPSPETLRRLLAATGTTNTGFRARLMPIDDYRVDPLSWLDLYVEGSIGINVGTTQFYAEHARKLALRIPNRFWCEHLTAVGHDMSVHVLLTHRMPFAQIAELGALAEPTLRRCKAAGRQDALLPLVEFYEADLPQVCREIWEQLSTPDDFERALSRERDELLARCRRRTRECVALLNGADRSRLESWKHRVELSLGVAEDIWRAARGGLSAAVRGQR